jgi:ferredoxin
MKTSSIDRMDTVLPRELRNRRKRNDRNKSTNTIDNFLRTKDRCRRTMTRTRTETSSDEINQSRDVDESMKQIIVTRGNNGLQTIPGLVKNASSSPYYREIDGDIDDIDATLINKAPSDFFELLSLDLDDGLIWTTDDEGLILKVVKKAFKDKLKICHPDVLMRYDEEYDEERVNAFAVILNAAYKTLSDPQTREPYMKAVINFRKMFFQSEENRFDGLAISKWSGSDQETRAVFVDESECIGCGNCAQYAQKTFSMDIDEDYGRARVINQWADDNETIEIAIDMCPVDCIYFVKRKQLAVLEHVMKSCPREDPGIMGRRRSGNFGSSRARTSPFAAAQSFLKRFDENGELFRGVNSAGLSFKWHDERLASTIAKAWIELPKEVRETGWKDFNENKRASFGEREYLKTR